jgi:hypothetical protein
VYFALNGYVSNWKSKYLILEKGISSGIHELKMTDLIDSILLVTGPSLFRNDKCG